MKSNIVDTLPATETKATQHGFRYNPFSSQTDRTSHLVISLKTSDTAEVASYQNHRLLLNTSNPDS